MYRGIHTAAYCSILQHCCNTLQHTATHRNTLQHTAAHCWGERDLHHARDYKEIHTATHYNILQHTAVTHCCNTLQHTAAHCWGERDLHHARDYKEIHTATHYNILQHTAITHCNTLQHTATHCWGERDLHHARDYRGIHTATHCNILQHTAVTHFNTLQQTATHLQHTAGGGGTCIMREITEEYRSSASAAAQSCVWVMSHNQTSHVKYFNESCHTYTYWNPREVLLLLPSPVYESSQTSKQISV